MTKRYDEGPGALLRRYRLAAALTQEELAAASGLSVRTISGIEGGHTTRPYWRTARLLADALGLGDEDRAAVMSAARGGGSAPAAVGHAVGADPASAAADEARPSPTPAQLPPDLVEFTGRTGQTAWLAGVLTGGGNGPGDGRGGPGRIAAITGLGGLGKSALAAHVAHRISARFPDGQLHIELRGSGVEPVSSAAALTRLLKHLGLGDAAVPTDTAERAAEYRTRIADRRMLVVLDDARDAAQVRPLLPGTASTAVLITSRNRLADLEGCQALALDGLSDAEAVALFGRICGYERVAAESAATAAVLDACAGLPLAVRIAASRLASRPGWTIRALADRLVDERQRLEELQVGDLAVRASFHVSYAMLAERAMWPAGRVASAFRLLGLWPGPDISLQAAAALLGVDDRAAARTLERLVDVHLLQPVTASRYRFHDLIRVFAAERAQADEDLGSREQAVRRVLSWYLHAADGVRRSLAIAARPQAVAIPPVEAGVAALVCTDYDQAVDWTDEERANLFAAVMLAARWGFHATCARLVDVVWRCYLRSPWEGWEDILVQGAASASVAGDISTQAWLLNYLSVPLMCHGRHHEALTCLEEALEVSRAAGDRQCEAVVTGHLAIACKELKRYDEAIAHFERALAVDADLDPLHRARTEMNLGLFYVEVGRAEEGALGMERALALMNAVGDHSGDSMARSFLASAYRKLGRYDDAVRSAERALEISRRDRDRYQEAAALHALGDILAESGDTATARTCLTSAYLLANDLGIPESAQISASIAGLEARSSCSKPVDQDAACCAPSS